MRRTGGWLALPLDWFSFGLSEGKLLEEVGKDGGLSGWILGRISIEVLEDGSKGHLLQQLEVTRTHLELDCIKEPCLHVLDVKGVLFNQEDKTVPPLLLLIWRTNHCEYLQTIQEPRQHPMLHLNHFHLQTAHTQTLPYRLPLVLLHLLDKGGRPSPVDITVYLRDEESVETAQHVLPGLGGEGEEGVVGIEDSIAVGDDEGAGVRHDDFVLLGDILIQDYTQEQLEPVLELLQLLIILPRITTVLAPQGSNRP